MRKSSLQRFAVRTRQRWLVSLAAAMLLAAAPAAFAAPVLGPDAEYSQSRLAPNPTGHAWGNVVPNALADYFTFVPYSTADATALGFPGTCGATSDPLAIPPVIGEDCYTITVKSFKQPLSLAPILGAAWGTNGLLDANDSYFLAANYPTVYGYGSGGNGWIPPQFTWGAGSTIVKNLSPVTLVKGNAPTTFAGFQFDTDKGIWHFPAPSIKGTKGRPIRIQWLNELPNTIIPGFDPTVDCSDSSLDCFPYNRIVTHVHGAHVGPASDGLTQAEYNPDFSHKGMKFSQSVLPSGDGPPGTYLYPMDQEAATIWYHDHAAGATHLNTNMGMAGFFPITDDNEKCLQGIPHPTLCPGTPTKYLPTGSADSGYTDSAYELGFALQDRVFYTDGQLAMPDAPVIDGNFPSCDQTDAASRLATCSPLFMYKSHVANADSKTPAGVHMVPYNETTMEAIPENNNAPYVATSATLEFFGNMPVVNGVVYGKYNVEPRVYRMRFIGGTDSRTWDLKLEAYDGAGNSLGFIPFWQIGTEQGFLNHPISRDDMLLMPGERLDALVNFGALPAGTTRVMLNNHGTDAPYQGEPLNQFNRSTDIPEIMQFNLIALDLNRTTPTPDVPAPSTGLALQRAGTPLVATPIAALSATPGTPIRKIALEEIVDEYQRIMPTIDRRGYDLPGMQATEIIKVNDTEIWDLINTTADAHPMHLHQVAFQVVHRQPFTSFTPAINDITNGVFSQPNYTADTGTEVLPGAHDAGWKDTVYTPPGFVTRVIAKFDLLGEYVWHCHILSHEEHDMMRPLKVVASALNPPTALTVPPSTPNDRKTTVTVGAPSPANAVADKYYVEFKKTTDVNWTTNLASGLSQTITFPSDGIYQLRAKAVDAAISPTYTDSTYVAGSNTIVVAPSDRLTPSSGRLTGATQTFTVSAPSGNYKHSLWVGTTAGGSELGRYNIAAGATQFLNVPVPTDGSKLFVRLWVRVPNPPGVDIMRYKDYILYASAPALTAVTLGTPAPASPQAIGTTVNFTATPTGGGAAVEYRFMYRLTTNPTYTEGQAYSTSNTWAWNTTLLTPGNYYVVVYARRSGDTAATSKTIGYTLKYPPITGQTLAALTTPSPQLAGTAINFTAGASGGSGTYQYRFMYKLSTAPSYTEGRAYSTTNTWTWDTGALALPAGTYYILVYIRNDGSAAASEASKTIGFVLK